MPVPVGYEYRPLRERFEEKYIPEPNSGCWLWIGAARGYEEYAVLSFKGRPLAASHISWFLKNGTMPHGIFVLHKCDTPLCVNPDHLFLGTNADNMADMVRKGRASRAHGFRNRGEGNGQAKLTLVQVEAILDDSRGRKFIAADYGVSRQQIDRIKNGKRWGAFRSKLRRAA